MGEKSTEKGEECLLEKVLKATLMGGDPQEDPSRGGGKKVIVDMEKIGAGDITGPDKVAKFIGAAKYHLRYKRPWD